MIDKKEILLAKIASCPDSLTVSAACEMFLMTMEGLEKQTDSLRNIKNKVGVKEYNALMNAILFSLFSAFYSNCEITKEEQKARIKEICDAFADLMVGAEIYTKKSDA